MTNRDNQNRDPLRKRVWVSGEATASSAATVGAASNRAGTVVVVIGVKESDYFLP